MNMKYIYILVIRIVLSIGVASIISFFFFNGIHHIKTPLLAGILLILAYLFEYSRRKE